MFIGREEELKFFEERYAAKGGQLIVLYGRRRIGKTETLKEFCKGKNHIFYSCTEIPDNLQLKSFSQQLLSSGMPAAQYISEFSDWEQAFRSMLDIPGDERKLVIIDEFPYMVRNNPSIPSILQNIWDHELKDSNVMLILCGSAMSFIEKEILSEKNPLYGRATGILKMTQMNFYDATKFMPSFSDEDKVAAYAILGGIPHYLLQFDNKISLAENIERSILSRGSILYSEVEFLIRQELREPAVYNSILEAVALGNTKLNDICMKTGIEKTKLSVYLNNLIKLGLIFREFSISDNVKIKANSNRGLYRISDNFFRFWFAFVFPNTSELESGDASGIMKHVVQPVLDKYVSVIFEEICQDYLRRLNRKEMLPFYFTKIGRWWNKTDEIDIMALDSSNTHIILGECKYKNSEFAVSDFEKLQGKYNISDKTAHYYLFSKSGFTSGLREMAAGMSEKNTDNMQDEQPNIVLCELAEIVKLL